jgi:tetratricopeptide (TPR) repeat protein
MPEISLHISNRRGAPAPAAAWLLPDLPVAAWLAELARLEVGPDKLRLYHLATESGAAGLLVIPRPQDMAAGSQLRAQPYAAVAGQIFYPCTAELLPAIVPGEVCDLLGDDLLVCHPQLGPVRLFSEQALVASSLLTVPPPQPCDWARAAVAITCNRALVRVRPPPIIADLDTMLDRGDIGRDANAIDDLVSGSPMGWVADRLHGLSERLGQGGAGTGDADGHRDGALAGGGVGGGFGQSLAAGGARAMEWLSHALRTQRARELERLAELFKSDPDKALRYALPLGGNGGAHRGLALPGGRLSRRQPNFSLSGLGGGGAVDAWDVDTAMLTRLRQEYRQEALRQTQRGAYRRAAYIYAELLGDLTAAAGTLKQGGCYREAAELYRTHLNQPREAAECLAAGGLHWEAIDIWLDLGELLQAGEAYLQIGREDQAHNCFRQVAEQRRQSRDYAGAAELFDERLDDEAAAADVLREGWETGGDRGSHCLQSLFGLYQRRSRADAGSALLREMDGDLPAAREFDLAVALFHVADSHPAAPFRHDLRMRATSAVSRSLCQDGLTAARRGALLRLLPGRNQADQLLQRDCRAYAEKVVERPVPRPYTDGLRVGTVVSFQLPADVVWATVVPAGSCFYAAGFDRTGSLWICRSDFAGHTQSGFYEDVPRAAVQLCPRRRTQAASEHLLVHVAGGPELAVQTFAADEHFDSEAVCSSVPWLPTPLLAIAGRQQSAVSAVYTAADELVLGEYSWDGRIQRTRSLTALVGGLPEDVAAVPTVCTKNELFVGVGGSLLNIDRSAALSALELPAAVHALAAAHPLARSRLAVSMELGVTFLWPGSSWRDEATLIAGELEQPCICFTRDSVFLALAPDGHGEAFDTRNLAIKPLGEFEIRAGADPLAMMPADAADRFAVLTRSGQLTVYEVSR